jgi:hypothetical protein
MEKNGLGCADPLAGGGSMPRQSGPLMTASSHGE